MTLDIDSSDIKPEDLPKEIRLKHPVVLSNAEGGMTIRLEERATATVLGYAAGIIEISDKTGKFTGKVPFGKTDFMGGVAKNRLNAMLGIDPEADKRKRQEEIEREAAERQARIESMKNQMAGGNNGNSGGSMGGGNAVVETKPEPEPEKEDKGPLEKELGEEELITVMQESIKKRMVSEFSFDGVLKWEPGDKETINDLEYQTGFATYEKETIFGKQPVIAKALVRNGKLNKWVYAKTGLDIP